MKFSSRFFDENLMKFSSQFLKQLTKDYTETSNNFNEKWQRNTEKI